MRVFIFPGQGSQKKGMGAGLWGIASEITAIADEILGYSIEKLCLEDPDNRLNSTEYTQPALYTVNALSWLRIQEEQGMPDFAAGHSLGEYSALFAAGVFDFATGLKLVQERGRLMALAKAGGMAAVIGADEQQIQGLLDTGGFRRLSIANYNTVSQIVISGASEEIVEAEAVFKSAGFTYIPLNVSGAFHTKMMGEAAESFGGFLRGFEFKGLRFPVVANVTARPYGGGSEVAELLPRQIVSPVRWTESIAYLLLQGEVSFTEVGPGRVLSKMVTAIEKVVRADPPPKFVLELQASLRAEKLAAEGI